MQKTFVYGAKFLVVLTAIFSASLISSATIALAQPQPASQSPRPVRRPGRPMRAAIPLPETPPLTSLCDLAPNSQVIFPQAIPVGVGVNQNCERRGRLECCVELPHYIHTDGQAATPQEQRYQQDHVRTIEPGTFRVTSAREGCQERSNTVWIRTDGGNEIILACTRESVGHIAVRQAAQFFGGLAFRGVPLPPRPEGPIPIHKPDGLPAAPAD